jgi:MFS family permease
VLPGATSPRQCGQVSTGWVTFPQVSWTRTTGGPPGLGAQVSPHCISAAMSGKSARPLPSVITSLHASLDQALWVVNAYLLVFATLLIVAGRLGDMFGPRRLFVAGLALFAVASALRGGPVTGPADRGAAGAGRRRGRADPAGHGDHPGGLPRERMGAAFGVFSSMVGLAAVSGPTLGGVLTTYLSWRWVFYVNLPIAAAGIVLAYRFVPSIRTGRRPPLDLPGVLLAAVGLAAVVYGVIEGQRYDWGTVRNGITIPEIIGAGLVVLAGFVAWERRQSQPLLPLGLFRGRTFAIMVVLNVAVQFALQSMLLVNSINLQSVLGFTAVHSGLTGLPLTLALTALAPFAGRLTDRFGGTLGGAVTGAVLATQLTAAMHLRATADARFLPPAARPHFVAGFAQAGRSGLQVGRGQAVASPPRGTPTRLLPELRHLIHDVFTHGYITAMRPTLAIFVAILLTGAAGCLLLRRHPAATPDSPPGPAAQPAPAQVGAASE